MKPSEPTFAESLGLGICDGVLWGAERTGRLGILWLAIEVVSWIVGPSNPDGGNQTIADMTIDDLAMFLIAPLIIGAALIAIFMAPSSRERCA